MAGWATISSGGGDERNWMRGCERKREGRMTLGLGVSGSVWSKGKTWRLDHTFWLLLEAREPPPRSWLVG